MLHSSFLFFVINKVLTKGQSELNAEQHIAFGVFPSSIKNPSPDLKFLGHFPFCLIIVSFIFILLIEKEIIKKLCINHGLNSKFYLSNLPFNYKQEIKLFKTYHLTAIFPLANSR